MAGERRWRAARLAGLTEIPACIRNITEKEAMELALVENLQREDLNPVEEAMGYRQLMDRCDFTQEQAAARVAKSRSAVANSLRLLNLPEDIQQMVERGEISAGHARTLLSFKNEDDMRAAAQKARHVYASEPVDRLREFMREKIRREKVKNVTVLDGVCQCLPYEDGAFDIVMSGHVLGDDYDRELAELERVTKPSGWILDCPGEDDRWKEPSPEMLSRGFECLPYLSKTGGKVCRYRKQVIK